MGDKLVYPLKHLTGRLEFQQWNPNSDNNHAYAPVLFESEAELLKIEAKLKENDILPRRYFYPSLDTLDYLKNDVSASHHRHCEERSDAAISQEAKQSTQHSRSIASRILCLPIYQNLSIDSQIKIISFLKEFLK